MAFSIRLLFNRIPRAYASYTATSVSLTRPCCWCLVPARLFNSRSILTAPPTTLSKQNSLAPQHFRTMFIQTQSTPNPRSMKFIPGKPVLGEGNTRDFQSYRAAVGVSPLASKLFGVDGVTGVYFGADFISININDNADWLLVKPNVFAVIMDHFTSGQPILREGGTGKDADTTSVADASLASNANDSAVVAMIKDLIETRIRPAVQEDGGDIVFKGFHDGFVQLQMQGSCVGCPSSSVTLRNGIENMLMHYVPEVQGVEEWVDKDVERVNAEQLQRLEQTLQPKTETDSSKSTVAQKS